MATRNPEIEERIQQIEDTTGKPVMLRPVRPTNCCFRGRVAEKQSCFLIEYRDDLTDGVRQNEILRELLQCIEVRRGQKITLYDGDVQYVEIPRTETPKGNRPSSRS
ncbi:MAG TPA: hypothetical protein QGH10_02565 [Armatimonadota bacterium]|nr:hypothetical protein [Armatimonadota bacterium]